jgi:hypothetical protein
VDQLVKENHYLQRLLKIGDTHGLEDYKSIDEQLKGMEERLINSQTKEN